jgi:hypothetical protein
MSEPEIDFLAEPVAEVETPVAETVVTPETAPAATTTAEPHEDRVPLAALKAEREKRQQYERELAAYRQKEQQAA